VFPTIGLQIITETKFNGGFSCLEIGKLANCGDNLAQGNPEGDRYFAVGFT